METKCLGDATIYFRQTEQQTAALVEEVYVRSIPLLHSLFGLRPAREIRFVVLTSHWGLMRHFVPRRQKVRVLLFLPLVLGQLKRQFAAHCLWTVDGQDHVLVGVKAIRALGDPPKLLRASWSDPELLALSSEGWLREWVRTVIVGACCEAPDMPAWLQQGIAGLIRDYARMPTPRPAGLPCLLERYGTLELEVEPLCNPEQANELPQEARDKLVAPDLLAYWVTRFLEETRPGLIRSLVQSGCRGTAFEREIAAACNIDPKSFAIDVVKLAAAHFRKTQAAGAAEVAKSAAPTQVTPASPAEEERKTPVIQSTSRTFRVRVPVGSIVFLGVLFSLWVFVSIAANYGGLGRDIGIIVPVLAGFVLGVIAMLPLGDFLRSRPIIEVNDECITHVASRTRRTTLPWHEVASVEEVNQGHALLLRNADRSVAIRVESQLRDFKDLVQIIAAKAHGSPARRLAKPQAVSDVALPATFYSTWEATVRTLAGLIGWVLLNEFYLHLGAVFCYGLVAFGLLYSGVAEWRMVRVSADAIVIRYPLRRRRIAFGDIRDVSMLGFKKPGIQFTLTDGRTVALMQIRGGVEPFYRALLAARDAKPESLMTP